MEEPNHFDKTENSFGYNPTWAIGSKIHGLADLENPMGTWTGLDPVIGAPLSGAMVGAGLGGLYGGAKWLLGNRSNKREGFWKGPVGRSILAGSLAGAGVGGVSAYLQKTSSDKQANSRTEVERIVRRDQWMSNSEKEQIIRSLQGADVMQLQRLAALGAAGLLTAVAARKILGLGAVGTAIAGGLGVLLARNYFSGPKVFV